MLTFGIAHLAFGIAGTVFPRWFFEAVPQWPPMHTGQIQIAGVFDLALAALFLITGTDLPRYLPLAAWVGGVAELGHALVRIGHVAAGDNPPDDLIAPTLMLLFGVFLLTIGVRSRLRESAP